MSTILLHVAAYTTEVKEILNLVRLGPETCDSSNYIAMQTMLYYSLLDIRDFNHMLLAFANGLDPDQGRQNFDSKYMHLVRSSMSLFR